MDDIVNWNGVYNLKTGQIHDLDRVVVIGLYYCQQHVITKGYFVGCVGWRSDGGFPVGYIGQAVHMKDRSLAELCPNYSHISCPIDGYTCKGD